MRRRSEIVLFLLLEILCIGAGMGVPIFCILLGFPVGWYIARRLVRGASDTAALLGRTLVYAALTSSVTLLAMAAIWLRTLPLFFDPSFDMADFGHPMILYDPRASYIGWLVLMVAISPFLQFLATASSAQATLWLLLRDSRSSKPDAGAPGV